MTKMGKDKKLMKTAPAQGMDLNQAFNQLIANNATIAQHVQAIKLVGKGIDISEIEKSNQQNQSLIVAIGNFINHIQNEKLPGKSLNRKQRRAVDKKSKKSKKGSK